MLLKQWMSPFLIQCFVTAGVSINMAGLGLVMGFSAVLLPQLRLPTSSIPIDDSTGSWIAAIPAISIILGNFIIPPIMGRFGRKPANLLSIVAAIIGWTFLAASYNVTFMIAARFVQGIAMGLSTALCPVLIGEYTSPRNRGAFLSTISLSLSLGVFLVQTIGSYLSWQVTALLIIGLGILNLVIVVFSPESPTFLADREEYDECRRIFTYLRGSDENVELENMIAVAMLAKQVNKRDVINETTGEKLMHKMNNLQAIMMKKEFYKPIIIMLHVNMMVQWCGINLMSSYTSDLFINIVGDGLDMALMVITLQVHRIVASIISMFLTKTVKRRTLLFGTVVLNLVMYSTIAAYVFCKTNGYLYYDHPFIGILLIHIHLFSVITGAVPLGFILAGEIFPMEYKSLCGGISTFFMSINIFIVVKTTPSFINILGIVGSYCLYGGVLLYCLIIVGITLPETKDKTLQEIEEIIKGKTLSK